MSLYDRVAEGDVYVVKKVLTNEIDNIRPKDLKRSLRYAVINSYADIVDLLLEHGADPNAESKYDPPLLSFARSGWDLRIARSLISHGANVNCSSPFETPLGSAIKRNYVDLIKLLVESGADVNLEFGSGYTYYPLTLAVNIRNIEVIRFLLDNGADPNVRTQNRITPLYIASYENRLRIVKLLLSKGADPNFEVRPGYISLSYALSYTCHNAIRILLLAGSKIDKEKLLKGPEERKEIEMGYVRSFRPTLKEIISIKLLMTGVDPVALRK